MGRILIIGATGTIGRRVAEALAVGNDIIRVGKSSGRLTVDIGEKSSIEQLFEEVGSVDAVISTAGQSRFGTITEAADEDYRVGVSNKLMGQVNLARIALRYVDPKGSITLTSGLLAREPWPGSVPTAMVNAALEGFVRAAVLDLPKGPRMNVVSPVLVTESARRMEIDTRGTMTAAETALAYVAAVGGAMNGQVLDCRDFGRIEEPVP